MKCIKLQSASRSAPSWCKPGNRTTPIRHNGMSRQLVVLATAPSANATPKVEQKNIGFVADMRKVAMKLHTKDQAPKEGGKEASKTPMAAWQPTREGYLLFLEQSKEVYDAFEDIIATNDAYAAFRNSGLERSAALSQDIAWFNSEYGLVPQPMNGDSPAAAYVALIRRLAVEDPPAFICHFYNFYFAHTAGGRMIGNKMAGMLLDNKTLAFYQWEGDVAEHLEKVRAEINRLAEGWSAEQKEHCLAETADSFKYSGALMRCMMGAAPAAH